MIPNTAHFIWLGSEFPWLNLLAVASAAKVGGFERLVLHVEEGFTGGAYAGELSRVPGLELRPVDVESLAAAAAESPSAVRRLYDAMTSPATRSDVLRALILASDGGVYLDTDTITVATFDALRRGADAFVGREPICFPGWSTARPSLTERARAYGLAVLRGALVLLPRGYLAFERVRPLYTLWVNNAVLGAAPGHPLLRRYLRAMLDLPIERARVLYAIGPDLLAPVCDSHLRAGGELALLGPEYFFPLPPVLSEHWWRRTSSPMLEEVLRPETLVVHWYASVRSRRLASRVDADYVREHQERQLFSRLAARYLDVT